MSESQDPSTSNPNDQPASSHELHSGCGHEHGDLAAHDHAAHDHGHEHKQPDPAEIVERERLDPEGEEYWYKNVYQGDHVPQLTLRAVLMGGILGALMSISNLYTSLKVGWAFGVAITACVLSFVIWRAIRLIFPKVSDMTILENNCMQSTASAAGYSTGATIATAFGALLLLTHESVPWTILLPWTIITACLGVFLAVPMKRQMINKEKLAFPSGIAAAETLKSLHGQSKEAITQAYSLVAALGVGSLVGFLRDGEFAWQTRLGMKIVALLPFSDKIVVNGVTLSKFPNFGFEPSVLLTGAGMIVGMRVSASMLLGSSLLYFVFGPMIVSMGTELHPAAGKAAEGELLRGWSLWTGTALMVSSGLTAFALQWKTIAKAIQSIKLDPKKPGEKTSAESTAESMEHIEVPFAWLLIGLIPLTIMMAILQYVAFKIAIWMGILAVILSFFLALVACRATGETDITPIGAMGKITQLVYAKLAPSNIQTNLMAASVTANIASSSADLLTDLKSGYLLGANPRKQFLAQFIGLFFGSLVIVPAWYVMVPNERVLEEKFHPPNVYMWKAVAEALSQGIDKVPETARMGLLIGGVLGILLAVADAYAPRKFKRFIPSAMGLGISWVVPFANSFAFFIGAVISTVWEKINKRTADLYVIPIASGAVAGESLICAVLAMIQAMEALKSLGGGG